MDELCFLKARVEAGEVREVALRSHGHVSAPVIPISQLLTPRLASAARDNKAEAFEGLESGARIWWKGRLPIETVCGGMRAVSQCG
jgi:hypothetical protein